MPTTPRSNRTPQSRAPKPTARIKRKKVSKRLEKIAREIKNSDDFVDHVAGLRNRYSHEYALRAGTAQAAVRQATRAFHRHATALALWLRQAHDGSMTAIEREVLDRIGTALHGSSGVARSQSAQVLDWSTRASQAVAEDLKKKSRQRNGLDHSALNVVAEGLRATFEHHKLKVTIAGSKRPSDAVLLLCAIARDAGDTSLQPDAAKAALRGSQRPRAQNE